MVILGWVAVCGIYATNTKVNLAFHPSRVGKSGAGLLFCLAGVKAGRVHLRLVAGRLTRALCDPIWQVALRSLRWVFLEAIPSKTPFKLPNRFRSGFSY